METRDYPIPISRRHRVAQIARWRENLIDCEIVVDDCRHEFTRAADALREALRERDRAAVHLGHLLELHDEEIGCALAVSS